MFVWANPWILPPWVAQEQQQQGGELNAASSSRSNSSDSNRSRQHATLQRQQPLLHAHPGRYPPMDAHACFDLVLPWVIRPIGNAHLETCAPMVSQLFVFVWPFPWTTVHGDRHEHPGRSSPIGCPFCFYLNHPVDIAHYGWYLTACPGPEGSGLAPGQIMPMMGPGCAHVEDPRSGFCTPPPGFVDDDDVLF